MIRPIKIALIAALPIEFVSLCVLGSWIKGAPADASSFEIFLHTAVGIMHMPGGYLLPLALDIGNYQLAVPLALLVVFLSGYLDWALLFITGIYAYRWLHR